jgi:hypothetical protein
LEAEHSIQLQRDEVSLKAVFGRIFVVSWEVWVMARAIR